MPHHVPYWQCAQLCEEHLYINESGRVGEVEPRGIAAYPFVNKGAIEQGWCEYQWLSNGEWVDRGSLPQVDVAPELMPPPILNVQNELHSADGIERWFLQRCMVLAQK